LRKERVEDGQKGKDMWKKMRDIKGFEVLV
jgi:hypothetical protein